LGSGKKVVKIDSVRALRVVLLWLTTLGKPASFTSARYGEVPKGFAESFLQLRLRWTELRPIQISDSNFLKEKQMADFRTKLITLAGVATMFAGMAHAQLNLNSGCTASSGAVFVASEGTTEQVSDTTITCAAQGNNTPTTVNISVYLSPAVTITSATLGSGSSARSEAMAGVTADFTPGGATNANVVAGVVSGSSITFNNIAITAGAPVSFTITNIKINASQIATSSGAPTAVTETIFLGGTNVTPGVLSAVNVAFATNGLANVKSIQSSGNSISSIPICSGINAFGATNGASNDTAFPAPVLPATTNLIGNAAFNIQFGEGFATAFKTEGSALVNTTIGSEFSNNTYTGYGVTAPTANTATSGTRIQIVFNNIPTNVTLYVPLSLASTGGSGGTMTLISSATAAYSAVTGSTANGAPGATAGNNAGTGIAGALTVSNGSATAIYEETINAPGAVETYIAPVFLAAGGAAVTAPASAITATVSFGPIGASSNIPNFVSGSSTATINGAAFSACSTTMLFPFVTNQLGFDTGIAIANTSSDLLNGGTKTTAANQSGTCSLTFFGASAPAAVTTASVAAGTVYAAAASGVAPGFQGYMIASCNFLYGHGFAYVVYNLTQSSGAAMGYLADVINADRKSTVAAEQTVGSNTPEN
jgi:hypothetical protein